MKKILITSLLFLAMLMYVPTSFAGVKAGDTELGLQTSLNSSWGDAQPDVNTFLLAGKVSHFVMDELSVGITSVGTIVTSDFGDTALLSFEAEPNWHFMTDTAVVPYVGPHAGFITIETTGFSETVFTYGVQGGVKAFVSENAAVDAQLRYTRFELDIPGAEPTNNLGVFVGLNLYFN